MSQNFIYIENAKQIVNSDSANKNQRPKFIVPPKDTAVSHYAKLLGMSNEEFMQWTGVKNSTIKKGTKVKLPMDKVPEGKGIYALAKKYNMSVEEFCKLNKIPKPYNEYKAQKNEEFYVKPYKLTNSKQSKNNKENNAPSAPPVEDLSDVLNAREDFTGLASGALVGVDSFNKCVWDSSFTPKEIAARLEDVANDKWGAVGKKPFDDMLKEINSKNVSDVLTEYSKANDGRSLINRITSEITSRQDARKDAVMYVYDALAKQKNIPQNERKDFEQELNAQFDSFGMVNTEKLDSMIDEMLKVPTPAKGQVISNKYTSYTVPAAAADTIVKPSRNKVFTAKKLQSGAIESAKDEAEIEFQKYCSINKIPYNLDNLDLSPMDRIPAPVIKDGKLVAAETELLKPISIPNGKVIILNPGHGGYSSQTGYFDTGTYSFIKKESGKYAPLIEYEKMKIYTEDTIDKLRAKGYAVVMITGHAETISDEKSVSKLIDNLMNGTKGGKKYSKDDIAFVSLHADSAEGQSGTGVCYDPNFKDDTKLAEIMKSNLNNESWIKAELSERIPGVNGLQVLMQSKNIPSVLLEVEYVNGSKCKNLDSKAFQDRFENKLIDGLDEYFGIK